MGIPFRNYNRFKGRFRAKQFFHPYEHVKIWSIFTICRMFYVHMKNISLVKKYALLILRVHSNCTFFLNMIDIFSKYRIYRRFYHIFHDVFYFYLIKLNALHISSYQIMLFLDIFIAYLLCIFRASVKIGDKIHVFCQKKMFQPKIPSIFV